jgi:hypothetical protein
VDGVVKLSVPAPGQPVDRPVAGGHQPGLPAPGIAALLVDAAQIFQQ